VRLAPPHVPMVGSFEPPAHEFLLAGVSQGFE
jgi:hypothetical protein